MLAVMSRGSSVHGGGGGGGDTEVDADEPFLRHTCLILRFFFLPIIFRVSVSRVEIQEMVGNFSH